MRSLVQLLTVFLVTVLQGASPHPWLLFANRKDIRLVDASAAKNRNNNVTVIIKDLEDAAALDYHYDKGMVCWTDISLEMIRCAFHQGANVINKTNVITTGKRHPVDTYCIIGIHFEIFISQVLFLLMVWPLIGLGTSSIGQTVKQIDWKCQHCRETTEKCFSGKIWTNQEPYASSQKRAFSSGLIGEKTQSK